MAKVVTILISDRTRYSATLFFFFFKLYGDYQRSEPSLKFFLGDLGGIRNEFC